MDSGIKLKHGSLFSGGGGFDLAAHWMGWSNQFHCEINPFCQQILKFYWPGATSYHDIKKTDFNVHRGNIDILTGGFPCQPFSVAGNQKGTDDDRHLWPEMFRAIREIQPTWIVGENVRGFVNWNGGLVFDEVQNDLASEGYKTTAFLLPAAGIGAPHRRDRIWIIAFSNEYADRNFRDQNRETDGIQEIGREEIHARESVRTDNDVTSNTGHIELQRRKLDRSFEKTEAIQENGGQFSRSVRSTWEKFPIESPLRGGNDGIPDKLDGITISKWCTESIKMMGNAIVPQVALQIFQSIEQYIIQNRTK